jgi:phosphoketolase
MKTKSNTFTSELHHKMDAYWRTVNYLSISSIIVEYVAMVGVINAPT